MYTVVGLRAVKSLSTPINVDRSPPNIGIVYDGSSVLEDIDYTSSSSSICMTWKGFADPHSHISSYQWTVGVTPGDNSTIELRNLTEEEINNRRACQDGLSLVHGTTYYSSLIVTNGAEPPLTVEEHSDGSKSLVMIL